MICSWMYENTYAEETGTDEASLVVNSFTSRILMTYMLNSLRTTLEKSEQSPYLRDLHVKHFAYSFWKSWAEPVLAYWGVTQE